MKGAVEEVLKGLNPKAAEAVRLDIEGSKAGWVLDENFARVRKSVDSVRARSLVKLEVGRAPGGRYSSLWFVDVGDEIVEFSTGSENTNVRRGTIGREDWDAYRNYLDKVGQQNLVSMVSPAIVDSPVYFLCLQVNGRETATVVEAMPKDVPQISAIARTFKLSRSKQIPRELEAYAGR